MADRAAQRSAPAVAWEQVSDWLAAPAAWNPSPGPDHAQLLGEVIVSHDARGNLVPDVMLAPLALEHGLTVYSADADWSSSKVAAPHASGASPIGRRGEAGLLLDGRPACPAQSA